MKVVFSLFAVVVAGVLLQSCQRDDFPVPPASTVSKFTYTVDNDGFAPATVTFTNTSIVPETVGDASYNWSFGDGATSTDESPVHVYTASGAFEVSLTVKTTISQEIKKYSETVLIKNANASGIPVYFTDGSLVYTGFLNNDPIVFAALPIGPFGDSYDLALDTVNNKLYISDYDNSAIYRCDADGSNLITFRSGLPGPDGLAIDYENNMLYWDTDDGIQRSKLNVANVNDAENFVTGQANDPEGVSIDAVNKKLYWTNYDGGLWSINLDGTAKTELIADVEGGSTLVIDNRVYFDFYVASGDIHLKSANLDGTGMGTITTGISKVVFGIGYEPEGKKIYWGDRSVGKIMRANTDGTGIETWYTKSGSSPRGIVFGKKK